MTEKRLWGFINYTLLFFMPMSFGVAGIAALVIIYLVQDGASPFMAGHYRFQKRTFWIGLGPVLLSLLSLDLHLPLVPYILFIPAFFWIVVRAVMGFNHVLYGRILPNPATWLV